MVDLVDRGMLATTESMEAGTMKRSRSPTVAGIYGVQDLSDQETAVATEETRSVDWRLRVAALTTDIANAPYGVTKEPRLPLSTAGSHRHTWS